MHAIRLIGENHTTHHAGEVLSIVDENVALTNRNVVTLENAHVLVERGAAEWVGAPPDHERRPASEPETEDEEFDRLLAEEKQKKEIRGDDE